MKICFVTGMCLLLWIICYMNTGDDKKNMLGFRSYPKAVQELVKRDPVLGKTAPANVNMVKVLAENIILFTVIFVIVGIILKHTAGFDGFTDAFIYFLILGETLNLFDLLIIDLLWWKNTSRIRFSCVPDKKLYQDPAVHIKSFLRGIIMYLVVAAIAAGILFYK